MTTKSDGGNSRARWLASAIVVLLVLSVPWYFPTGDGRPLILGVPLWAFVSLGCYTAIALIVAAWLPSLWNEDTGEERWRR